MKRFLLLTLAFVMALALISPATVLKGLAAGTGAGITFTPSPTYEVKYSGGEGYSGLSRSLPPTETHTAGASVTTARGDTLNMADHGFVGWRYDGPATVTSSRETVTSGTILVAGARFSMPSGDVTLTAQWVRVYTVTFHKNDYSTNPTFFAVFVPSGKTIGTGTITSQPTRPNYTFIGWSLRQDSRASELSSIVTMAIFEDLTVYAQWRHNVPEPTPSPSPPPEPSPSPSPPTPPTPPTPTPDPTPDPSPVPMPEITPPPTPDPSPAPVPDPIPETPPSPPHGQTPAPDPTSPQRPSPNPRPTQTPSTVARPRPRPIAQIPPGLSYPDIILQYAIAQDEDETYDDHETPFMDFDPELDPFIDPDIPDEAPGPSATVFNPQDFVERDIIVGEVSNLINTTNTFYTSPVHKEEESIRILDKEVPRIGFAGMEVPIFPTSPSVAVWALFDLLFCLLGITYAVAFSLRALFWKIHGKAEIEETYRPEADDYMDYYKERRTVKQFKLLWLAATAFLAAIGALLFLLKEDMSNMMVLIDWWTLPHAIIFAAEIIAVMFVFKKKQDYYDLEEATA